MAQIHEYLPIVVKRTDTGVVHAVAYTTDPAQGKTLCGKWYRSGSRPEKQRDQFVEEAAEPREHVTCLQCRRMMQRY